MEILYRVGAYAVPTADDDSGIHKYKRHKITFPYVAGMEALSKQKFTGPSSFKDTVKMPRIIDISVENYGTNTAGGPIMTMKDNFNKKMQGRLGQTSHAVFLQKGQMGICIYNLMT